MEARLDDLLSRIAMETDEIKELEQQLTDGQILANEALQRDLKEVICGLQEYLRGLGQQPCCSQLQADRLQDENQRLQRLLEEALGHCRQQEDRSHTHTKMELSALWMEAQSIRDRQTQLEAGLLQLREELTQQVTLRQEDDWSPQEVNLRLQAQLDQNRVHFNYIGTQLDQFTSILPELQTDPEENKIRPSGPKHSLFFRTTQHTEISGRQLQEEPNQNQLIQDQENSSVDKNTELRRSHQQNPAPSLESQGTQDSGLGLQYPSSPDRGQQQDGLSAEGGYWVYIPTVHQERECVCSDHQNDDVLSDCSSREGSPPPPPPPPVTPAASAGVTDARTPPRGLASPPSKGTSLHCRPPQQKHVEDAEHLKEKKKKLRMETKWLRHKLRQHRCVMQVCDELECLEETLLKRRAELRESDRLLLEAERLRDTTGGQVDVLLLRRLTSASSLLEAAQHLRELRRRREEEELTLWEVEEAMRSRHQEFKQLNTKIKAAANRLAGVYSDCQEAQRHLESLTCQEEHKEQRLARMKEEHRAALSRVEELREEEQKLQSIIKDLLEQQEVLWSKRRSTVSDVRSEEQKLVTVKAELRSHRAELKQVLREERSRMQERVVVKREELAALQQGVTLGLKDVKQLRDELQEVQEKLSRRRKKRSSLQEQCKQLEARRSHANRCLSVLEAELGKQGEELNHTHFIK